MRYDADMSEITTSSDRDGTGRFVSGCKPGPGRSQGSRGRLASDFLRDLHAAWNEHGVDALARCAKTEPGVFCKIIANLLPRDIDINLVARVDAADFATKFRDAVQLLGNEPPRVRKLKTIEHDDAG
jgi:hypothetical protein